MSVNAAHHSNSGGKSTSASRALEQPRGCPRSLKEVFKPLFIPGELVKLRWYFNFGTHIYGVCKEINLFIWLQFKIC